MTSTLRTASRTASATASALRTSSILLLRGFRFRAFGLYFSLLLSEDDARIAESLKAPRRIPLGGVGSGI